MLSLGDKLLLYRFGKNDRRKTALILFTRSDRASTAEARYDLTRIYKKVCAMTDEQYDHAYREVCEEIGGLERAMQIFMEKDA